MGRYHQGTFRPKNPCKYKGNVNNITYRSRWELMCMMKFDSHPDIIEWSSEEVVVKYISPLDLKVHRYFIDFKIVMRDKTGNVKTVLIEVKPKKQTTPPKVNTSAKPNRRYINEVATWGVNEAKWKAARLYCKERGWTFEIINEDHIFGKTGKK